MSIFLNLIKETGKTLTVGITNQNICMCGFDFNAASKYSNDGWAVEIDG